MQETLIARISSVLVAEKSLEGLVRQLLEMLELVTNMESTYLTHIESDKNVQHVLFSRNSKKMQIPEGLSVPWEDTLCRRALSEDRCVIDDVPSHWGDSQAAKQLGITTYVTTPVRLDDGSLYGTLCAVSGEKQKLDGRSEQILQLFAELIAQYIQKEQLLCQLQEANAALTAFSYTDELTQLPNRRSVFKQLPQLFSHALGSNRFVVIAFIDLDGFKLINDRYGHEAGDDFLCAVGLRLRQGIRVEDMLGRIGGDEFIVATTGPYIHENAKEAAQTFKARLTPLLIGDYALEGCHIDYAGASIGAIAINPALSTPDEALRAADTVMYEEKKQRRRQLH